MKKLIGIISMLIGLTACHTDYNEQYFMTHPADMMTTLEACQTASTQSMECIYAQNAYENVISLQRELMQDPQLFGQKVLAAQITLAHLNAAFTEAPAPAAKAALDEQRDLVARYLAVCSVSGE